MNELTEEGCQAGPAARAFGRGPGGIEGAGPEEGEGSGLASSGILQLLDQDWTMADATTAAGTYPREVRRVRLRFLAGGLVEALGEDARPKPERLLDAGRRLPSWRWYARLHRLVGRSGQRH
jgi:hypothetical protein